MYSWYSVFSLAFMGLFLITRLIVILLQRVVNRRAFIKFKINTMINDKDYKYVGVENSIAS